MQQVATARPQYRPPRRKQVLVRRQRGRRPGSPVDRRTPSGRLLPY
jgi:hypothetical protein